MRLQKVHPNQLNYFELSLRAHRNVVEWFSLNNERDDNDRKIWWIRVFRMNRFFTSTNCIELSACAFSGDFKVVKIAFRALNENET